MSHSFLWILIAFFVLDAVITVAAVIYYTKKQAAKLANPTPSKCPVCGMELPKRDNALALLATITCTNCGTSVEKSGRVAL